MAEFLDGIPRNPKMRWRSLVSATDGRTDADLHFQQRLSHHALDLLSADKQKSGNQVLNLRESSKWVRSGKLFCKGLAMAVIGVFIPKIILNLNSVEFGKVPETIDFIG